MRLTLRNGRLVTPHGTVHGGILSEDGIITHIGPDATLPTKGDVIDAQGKWVLPGVIDPHTHIGVGATDAPLDLIRRQWESESRGAIHKGVTTIISFQGGSPIPMHEPHLPMLERQIAWAEEASYSDFALHTIMQTDDYIAEQAALAARGVVGFKHFYTAYKPGRDATLDQITIGYTDDGMLYESFAQVAAQRADGANVLPMIHAEDADICAVLERRLKTDGRSDLAAWAEARPNVACYSRSLSASEIAQAVGAPLYIVHITTAEEVDLVRRLRAQGVQIHGETVLHYLTHTKDMEGEWGCWPKVIPAIKGAVGRDALWRGLADGTLATLGTDHAAWMLLEKQGPGARKHDNIWSALPGMSGMECILPVLMTLGVRAGRLDIETVAKVTSENVARQFGLYPRKGVLQVGSDADYVVVDPDRHDRVDDAFYRGSTAEWSIYHGFEFRGVPETTVLRGQLMVERGEIVGQPGSGRYVRAAA